MASNAEITVTINGVTTAVKDFDELADAISGVDKNVDKLNDDLTETGKKGKKATQDLGKGAKDADKEMGPLQKRFNDIKETVKGFGTDAKNGFSAAFGGIQKFAKGLGLSSKAAKGLSISLAALGIPLLIAAITALVSWFKNFEGAQKAVQIVTNSLAAVFKQLGGAFGALLRGDWKGLKASIAGIGDAVKNAASSTNALFAAQKQVFELTKRYTVENAKLRKTLEEQKKTLEDTTLPLSTRLSALEEVRKATEQLAQNQVNLNKAQLADLQAQLALANNYEERRELQLQIADAQASLIESESELQSVRQDANKVEREIRAEEKARQEEKKKEAEEEAQREADLAAEKVQKAKEVSDTLEAFRVKLIEDEAERIRQTLLLERNAAVEQLRLKGATEAQIAELNGYYDELELQQLDAFNAQKKAKEDAAADAAVKAKEDEAARIQAIEMQKLQFTADTFAAVAGLLGESTFFGKAAASASALINTYLGATQAYNSQLIPGDPSSPIRAAIAAGVAIAGGLKNVYEINSTETPKGALGGYVTGPSHAMGGVPVELEGGEYVINRAAMSMPGVAKMARSLNNAARPKFQNGGIVPDLNAQQDMFERLAQQPVKTYVVATEMTDQQEANAVIENLARL